jgi:uncharacterized protein (TIGR01244 family)
MLDIRQISPDFAVAPQIDPEDFPAIRAAGFKTVINNRPDSEIPPTHHDEAMRRAAEAAGLSYVAIPVAGRAMTMETVGAQAGAIAAADGPILAYCASGTRSVIAWSLAQAGRMAPDAILRAAAQAGYQLDHLRPHLEALAADAR